MTGADCFLVATGISRSFEELDPARLRNLLAAVREFEPADASVRPRVQR